MKRLTSVLTAALLLAVIAAGCSSGSDEPEVPTPQYKVTKENIVGVWRSGDYWVSFSEDGYNSAYFPIENDERIDEGSYTISGDTITVENSLYYSTTRYIVSSLSGGILKMMQIYNMFGSSRFYGDDYDIETSLTLTKSDERPPVKINEFGGLSFSYRGAADKEFFTCDSLIYHNTFNEDYHEIKYTTDVKNKWGSSGAGWQYYIYLSPVIYHVTLPLEEYKKGAKVNKAKLTKEDGKLLYQRME